MKPIEEHIMDEINNVIQAHQILNTSTETTEISNAIDYITDHRSMAIRDGRVIKAADAHFKVEYLISQVAWSNKGPVSARLV